MNMGKRFEAVDISCQELFEDWEFLLWLNETRGIATWHLRGLPTLGSDVFVLYDHGDSPEHPDNVNGMPAKCWKKIEYFCRANGIGHAILRLQNL